MSPADRYLKLKDEVAALAYDRPVKIVVVTKKQPVDLVQELFTAGCRDVGENRVAEALEKQLACPQPLRWHLIGTLQSKKVRQAIGHFALIHSVDTPALAERIQQHSQEASMVTPILLQVNTSGEATKHGLTVEEWKQHLDPLLRYKNISIAGLMTMAPLTGDSQIIRHCFARLRRFRDDYGWKELSMGMSNDYRIALEEGATMLRIGSLITDNHHRAQ